MQFIFAWHHQVHLRRGQGQGPRKRGICSTPPPRNAEARISQLIATTPSHSRFLIAFPRLDTFHTYPTHPTALRRLLTSLLSLGRRTWLHTSPRALRQQARPLVIHTLLLSFAQTENMLLRHHLPWISLAHDLNRTGQHLLKGQHDQGPLAIKPLGEGLHDRLRLALALALAAGLPRRHRQVVHGDVLLGVRRDLDAVAGGAGADVDGALLHGPDPEREQAVEQRVERDRHGRVLLRGVEAELVVPVEGRGADGEGRVAQREARVREGVRLLELEGVEVGRDGIVGGVFEIWEGGWVSRESAEGELESDRLLPLRRFWRVGWLLGERSTYRRANGRKSFLVPSLLLWRESRKLVDLVRTRPSRRRELGNRVLTAELAIERVGIASTSTSYQPSTPRSFVPGTTVSHKHDGKHGAGSYTDDP